ncbi:phosphoserine phosphatase-like [Clavelina lepadiformis]
MDENGVKEIWRSADAVCLDVDSTVCQDEGIDVFASFCGLGKEVKDWTNRAMGGSVSFQESLKARLGILNPTAQKMKSFIETHKPQLTPGVETLVKILKSRNCQVYLVSGGMQEIIEPVAKILDIPVENIFANKLKYFFNGDFAGFDESCPTSRSGGKPRVMSILKERHNYKNLVMIGDGVTDLEASPPADAFIGFGGNVVRNPVKENAKWFVTSFQQLIDELNN